MLTPADLSHLRRAIELAGAARAHGNHPFGAALVGPTGEVLAEAENSVLTDLDCTAHAELNLIRLASRKCDAVTLAASTLYASTEPCAMCAGAIHWSGIGRLVYGLAEERLYELSGADPADRPLKLPCREVLLRCARPIEILGPVWLFDDDDTLERVAVQELAPLSAMYIDFIGRLGRLADPLLRFNLNVWTVIITAVLLVPLATLSAAHWPRKEAW